MTDPLLAFTIFALVTTLTPGGSTALATSSGLHFGLRRSVPLFAGITTAMAMLAALAASGLGILLLNIPAATTVLKTAGTLYLAWLAWRVATAGAPTTASRPAAPIGFVGGFAMLLLNPKAWISTLSAAASYAAISQSPFVLAGTMAGIFSVCSVIGLWLWASSGQWLSQRLRREAHWHWVNGVLAALLVLSVVGIWV